MSDNELKNILKKETYCKIKNERGNPNNKPNKMKRK